MLKKIMKLVLRKLHKVDWLKAEVEAYQLVEKKRKHHEHWANLMCSGGMVHDLKPTKLDPWDTLPVRVDGGMYEELQNGKVVGRGYIDTWNWGSIDV